MSRLPTSRLRWQQLRRPGGGDHDVADTTETLSVSGLGVTLEEAIKIAMENGDVGASGVPLVSKLKELTGRDVTAAERDEIIDG